MTIKVPDDEEKKAIAAGRKRRPAVEVVIPRILGALENDGQAHHPPGYPPMLVAARDRLRLDLILCPGAIALRALWQDRLVMSGEIHLDGLGEYYAGRVSVATWERGAESRAWQTELFDTFSKDSERLLTIPLSDLPAALARLLRLPEIKVEKILWGGPITQTKEIAAQHLWHDLGDACARGGRGQLTTEELGQVVLELGLGLLASEHEKEELLALLDRVRDEIERDRLSIVNAGLMRDFWNPHLTAQSRIRSLSGLDDAPSFWATAQMLMVGKLRPDASARRKAR